jgi:NADPH-dependent glutamate synthase beta subunit-like oxidoreductase/coenzyme F420-reducing hydrogenase delta subunit
MSEQTKIQEQYAPCIVGCPVHTDTQKLAELVTLCKYEDALDLLLEANPFSSVCGRICHHPCEQNCRRSKVDAPVGLMKLKRFIMEETTNYRLSRRKKRPISEIKTKRVAIVGSGPSGMTAAQDLAILGYHVTVFERSKTPGGLLGSAIPRYRLPYSVVKDDIEDILSLGVELRTGVEIGKAITINKLFEDGFEAVLLATGLSESRNLNIPGIDSNGVLLALPFLYTVISGKPPQLGKRVAVIGGGNVAIDVARCAKRVGAEKVTMVCLESEKEMPAWDWEREEAAEEGISVMHSWGPKAVFAENNQIKGLELKRCKSVFDDTGRFNPQFDPNDNATLLADTIIIAIGQRGDISCVEGGSLKVGPNERLVCDRETLTTSQDGVFACGELSTGPGSSVEAVHDGHRAAKAIDFWLQKKKTFKQPFMELPAISELPDETVTKIKKLDPTKTALLQPSVRVKDFIEIERGFTEEEAHSEARRCLACTTGALADEEKCAACLTCVRICPFGVATVEQTAAMPQEKCQACGLCAAECPAAAIALKRFGTNRMAEDLRSILSKSKEVPRPLIISFCCIFEVTSRSFIREKTKGYGEAGIYIIMVPCIARLSVPDILSPFELGADSVSIFGCKDGECLYPTAEERLLARIRKAKEVLEEVGVEGERIDYWKTESSAEVSWTTFWEISRRKLDGILNTKK